MGQDTARSGNDNFDLTDILDLVPFFVVFLSREAISKSKGLLWIFRNTQVS
jgi:hypothetical protein